MIKKLIILLALPLLLLISCKSDLQRLERNEMAWMDSEQESEIDMLEGFISALEVKQVFIHCDATGPNSTWDKDDLLNFFHNERGWTRPGYHFWIDRAGKIHPLWPLQLDCNMDFPYIVNGARGHNRESIHVCYQGGVDIYGRPRDTRTDEQKASLLNLLKVIKNSCPDVLIKGHREVSNKACPSFDAALEYKDI